MCLLACAGWETQELHFLACQPKSHPDLLKSGSQVPPAHTVCWRAPKAPALTLSQKRVRPMNQLRQRASSTKAYTSACHTSCTMRRRAYRRQPARWRAGRLSRPAAATPAACRHTDRQLAEMQYNTVTVFSITPTNTSLTPAVTNRGVQRDTACDSKALLVAKPQRYPLLPPAASCCPRVRLQAHLGRVPGASGTWTR